MSALPAITEVGRRAFGCRFVSTRPNIRSDNIRRSRSQTTVVCSLVEVTRLQVSAFEGQTAVITGGGKGVGAAIAVALADAKVNVHLIGRRLERLEAVAASARRLGAHAVCYSIDLATESGQIDVTRKLQRDLPSIDILIQNAATFMT